MNAAEKVTMEWLMAKGYFVMSGVKQGRREADFLAIKLGSSGQVEEKAHVEVQVSSNPAGDLVPAGYVEGKFGGVEDTARKFLGNSYSKWVVLGMARGGREGLEAYGKEFEEVGVRTISFRQVIEEYLGTLTTRPLAEMGDLLHILRSFGFVRAQQEN
ncbi:MAG: hypothetical protein WAM91_07500 [Candidatus Acidiferrales bacterium]